MPESRKIKLFISHATEDKKDFVEPLVAALKSEGYELWYDKDILQMGDIILKEIGKGLRDCDFAIVVFSKAFFAKKWTNAETEGLFALQKINKKLILPVWKDVTEEDVNAFNPIFTNRVAAMASEGIQQVVKDINNAVLRASDVAEFNPLQGLQLRLRQVSDRRNADAHNERLLNCQEGVAIIREALETAFDCIESSVHELNKSGTNITVHECVKMPNYAPRIVVAADFDISGELAMEGMAGNNASVSKLVFRVRKSRKSQWTGRYESSEMLYSGEFRPFITSEDGVEWATAGKRIENAALIAKFFSEIVSQIEKCEPKRR